MMPRPRFRHIVVEGPIGVGKTSLARRLSEHLQAELLLENAADNPFLPRFYQDPKRYALATQLHFLFDRARQVSQLAQGDLFRHSIVADFLLDKDRLFARLNLEHDEYELYRKVYDDLALQTPAPDLVIYLQAPLEKLRELYRQRDPLYREIADIVVDTGRQSVAGMTRVLYGKLDLLRSGLPLHDTAD